MNHEEITTLNADHVLNLQITFPAQLVTAVVHQLAPILVDQLKTAILMPAQPQEELKLAYSMRETADLLGISYMTVHRLIQRGLLRPSNALRTKIISEKEIRRFLAETTQTA